MTGHWKIVLLLLLAAQGVLAQGAEGRGSQAVPSENDSLSMALVRFGFFIASDPDFKPIYGSGGVFGGELRLGRRSISGWLEGNYRSRTGKFSMMGEGTKVKVMAIEGGVLVRILSGTILPYAGLGIGYYMFTETDDLIGEAKKSKLGFCGAVGVSARILKMFALDCRVKYSSCKMQPADYKIDIGGLTLGLGLGLFF